MKFRPVETISNGDRAANRGVANGTHTGPLELPTGTVPATNKPLEVEYASFFRIDGSGLVTEERRYYDLAGMLAQLGLMG